jgi:hypothetical protein
MALVHPISPISLNTEGGFRESRLFEYLHQCVVKAFVVHAATGQKSNTPSQ